MTELTETDLRIIVDAIRTHHRKPVELLSMDPQTRQLLQTYLDIVQTYDQLPEQSIGREHVLKQLGKTRTELLKSAKQFLGL